jgi:polyphosphate kinase
MANPPESSGEEAPVSFIPRDISWLHFNYRVLQEARDESVPLYERIKFLAIYSSNLDEFFRVRVASLRSFRKLKKGIRKEINLKKPKRTLRRIRKIVEEQQTEFGSIFKEGILPALASRGIHLVHNDLFTTSQAAFSEQFFDEKMKDNLTWHELKEGGEELFLKNKALYFVVQWEKREDQVTVVQIPTDEHPRFIIFPRDEERYCITFLDDILRHNLPRAFPDRKIKGIYSIKLSRDAELYIEDEFSGDLVEKLKAALEERDSGLPIRFLYDADMPEPLLGRLKKLLGISKYELIPGARYHNFNDFFGFPDPLGAPDMHDPYQPPLPHPVLEKEEKMLEAIREKDYILHFPYQSFDYVLKMLEEAVFDPGVSVIRITLYRVAPDSRVGQLLLEALAQGKKVTAFIEAKARFDEASNLSWGEKLQAAGGNVLFSRPGIKVHTKLFMVERKEDADSIRRYAYVGTGNFNEKTARLYCDHALLTADARITAEVAQVFEMLETGHKPSFAHLFVSPYHLRKHFTALIDAEIERAEKGEPAWMILKLNSLQDEKMIEKLYQASRAGVKIQLIVRGICGIRAGLEGISENIQCRSIVDRYLEHARVYIFGNGGEEKMYIASADWMTRNLDHRVEVAAPIYDHRIKKEIRAIIDLQLADNTKARILQEGALNDFYREEKAGTRIRAQLDTYNFLKKLNN